jgi:hypothetical protein
LVYVARATVAIAAGKAAQKHMKTEQESNSDTASVGVDGMQKDGNAPTSLALLERHGFYRMQAYVKRSPESSFCDSYAFIARTD